MPANAGIHEFLCAAPKQALLFLKKSSKKLLCSGGTSSSGDPIKAS
jgi:hypothetical protein